MIRWIIIGFAIIIELLIFDFLYNGYKREREHAALSMSVAKGLINTLRDYLTEEQFKEFQKRSFGCADRLSEEDMERICDALNILCYKEEDDYE